MATTMVLRLERKTLKNVDDAAGRWQFEGGEAFRGTRKVANYATVRRVTMGGTDEQNTAMLTTTLFFIGRSAPPQNITLQGSHDFSSGNQVGSVSAASNSWSQYIEGQFRYTASTDQLRITTT